MNTVFSLKNTGLSGNILKFLILFDFCKKSDRELVFPCSDTEKEIMLRFDHVDLDIVSFPGYNQTQKQIFNENYRKNDENEYIREYLFFINKWYSFSIKGTPIYVYGNVDSIPNTKNCTVLIDYNDGLCGYRRSLGNVYTGINFSPILSDKFVFRNFTKDVVSFNLKTTTPENFESERNYWIKAVEKYLLENPSKTPFFVSGNNEMKNSMCERFGIKFSPSEVEKKMSIRESGEIIRGKSSDVIVDIQNCVNTRFVSIEELAKTFSIDGICPCPSLFRTGKAEKFDLLVEFLKTVNFT
jgi:hypothetical protein